MKPKTPNELLEKARRVYREPMPEILEQPPGFAHRVVAGLAREPSRQWMVWEKLSYAGVATAAAIAIATWTTTSEPTMNSTANAAELWMEMPMSEDFEL